MVCTNLARDMYNINIKLMLRIRVQMGMKFPLLLTIHVRISYQPALLRVADHERTPKKKTLRTRYEYYFFFERQRGGGYTKTKLEKSLKKKVIFSIREEIPALRFVFFIGLSRSVAPFSHFYVLPWADAISIDIEHSSPLQSLVVSTRSASHSTINITINSQLLNSLLDVPPVLDYPY